MDTAIEPTNIQIKSKPFTVEVRVDSFGREIGIIVGDNAIYMRRSDVPRLIEFLGQAVSQAEEISAKISDH